jgi:hypothetical protein
MVDRGSNWDRSALGHVIAFTHALGVGDARVKDAEHLAWAHRFAAADAKVHEIVTTTRPTVRKRIAEHVAKLD